MTSPDFAGMVPAAAFLGDDDHETALGRELGERARGYLEAFRWCLAVEELWCGIVVPGVIGVFLARISPGPGADRWMWPVVGDVPPAYIAFDPATTPNAACALDAYVGEMERWVRAARAGEPVDALIPVNVAPSDYYADRLDSRLRMIDELILVHYRDDLV